MSNSISKHATLVQIDGKGVLLCGKSGTGKSDLALRLIENRNAVLVADDMVELFAENGVAYGRVPDNLRGLLEVRGVGIAKYPFTNVSTVDLVVDLLDENDKIERLPKVRKMRFFDSELLYLTLHANDVSAEQKILVKLRDNLLPEE